MEGLGSDTLVLITSIGVFAVPLAAIVVLLPQLLPVTLAYFRDISPLQRNILLCCLLLAIFTGVFREGIFDVILAVLPNSALIIVLSTLAPTLCIAWACQRARICHPLAAVALLGLPVGIVLSVLAIIGLLSDLTDERKLLAVSAMTLLPVIVGGAASVFCYSWPRVSEQPIDQRTMNTKEIFAVFLSFATIFVCSLATILNGMGFTLDYTIIGTLQHPNNYAILISILILVTMINHKSETMLLRASNGCLIVFGLTVGIGTVNYFAVNNNPGEIGYGLAFSLVGMFYSSLLYVCIVIWTMLNKQLRPNMFALKNWHLAEMFTFWVFALMSPPSLWEALEAAGSDEEGKTEQMEMRISELEDRLATLSSQDSVYAQPLDN